MFPEVELGNLVIRIVAVFELRCLEEFQDCFLIAVDDETISFAFVLFLIVIIGR